MMTSLVCQNKYVPYCMTSSYTLFSNQQSIIYTSTKELKIILRPQIIITGPAVRETKKCDVREVSSKTALFLLSTSFVREINC